MKTYLQSFCLLISFVITSSVYALPMPVVSVGTMEQDGQAMPWIVAKLPFSWTLVTMPNNLISSEFLNMQDVKCRGKYCIAYGSNDSSHGDPYFAFVSTNYGMNWSTFTNSSIVEYLKGSVCNANECLLGSQWSNDLPKIYYTADFNNFQTASITNNIDRQNFHGTSMGDIACSEIFCVTGGASIYEGKYKMYVLSSYNAGHDWYYQEDLPDMPFPVNFESASRAGCGKGGCFVAGYYRDNTFPYPVIVNTINGIDWTVFDLRNKYRDMIAADLNGAGCTDTFCVLVGEYRNPTTRPFLLTYSYATHTWVSSVNVDGNTKPVGTMQAVACSSSFCIAVGGDDDLYRGAAKPLILYTDDGTAWHTIKSISGTPYSSSGAPYGVLKAIKCDETSCAATGYYYPGDGNWGDQSYLILESSDKGQTWKSMRIADADSGQYLDAKLSLNKLS